MDNRINKDNLSTYYTLKEEQFFKAFAKDYLNYLGNSNPTSRQLTEIQHLLILQLTEDRQHPM